MEQNFWNGFLFALMFCIWMQTFFVWIVIPDYLLSICAKMNPIARIFGDSIAPRKQYAGIVFLFITYPIWAMPHFIWKLGGELWELTNDIRESNKKMKDNAYVLRKIEKWKDG